MEGHETGTGDVLTAERLQCLKQWDEAQRAEGEWREIVERLADNVEAVRDYQDAIDDIEESDTFREVVRQVRWRASGQGHILGDFSAEQPADEGDLAYWRARCIRSPKCDAGADIRLVSQGGDVYGATLVTDHDVELGEAHPYIDRAWRRWWARYLRQRRQGAAVAVKKGGA